MRRPPRQQGGVDRRPVVAEDEVGSPPGEPFECFADPPLGGRPDCRGAHLRDSDPHPLPRLLGPVGAEEAHELLQTDGVSCGEDDDGVGGLEGGPGRAVAVVEGIGELVVGVDPIGDVDEDEVVESREVGEDGPEHGTAHLRPALGSRESRDDVEVIADDGVRHRRDLGGRRLLRGESAQARQVGGLLGQAQRRRHHRAHRVGIDDDARCPRRAA